MANVQPEHGQHQPQAAINRIADRVAHTGKRPMAEVVAILSPSRKRSAAVGFLVCPGNADQLQLLPCDPCLPRVLIPAAELSQLPEFRHTSMDTLQHHLFLGAIGDWPAAAQQPEGKLLAALGAAGQLQAESQAILATEGIRTEDFSAAVQSCLPPPDYSIPAAEIARRRDLRSDRILTVDPPTARDLDDALSICQLPDGSFRVGVHIADVSHFVPRGCALDEEAALRGTSTYLVEAVVPMLPRRLCESLCSLNPGVDRLAFSIIWDLTPEGQILQQWMGKTVIRSCVKLAYQQAQAVIQEDSCSAAGGEGEVMEQLQRQLQAARLQQDAASPSVPTPEPPHSWAEVAQDIRRLFSISRHLKQRRVDNGALRLDNLKYSFCLDAQGQPLEAMPEEKREANSLVEEFMLLANVSAAHAVTSAFPEAALRRCHPPPKPLKKLQELEELCHQLGLPMDASSAGALQASLLQMRSSVQEASVVAAITMLATRPMQPAIYFCTGEDMDAVEQTHYALAVPEYTHFTSPIRRYADVIVHRLLAAALAAGEAPSKSNNQEDADQQQAPYTTAEVTSIARVCTACKASAAAAQAASQKLYLAMLLRDNPLITEAIVTSCKGAKFFDVFVPAIGSEHRIHVGDIRPGPLEVSWNVVPRMLSLTRYLSSPPGLTSPPQPSSQANSQTCDDGWPVKHGQTASNPSSLPALKLPLQLQAFARVPVMVTGHCSSPAKPAGIDVCMCVRT